MHYCVWRFEEYYSSTVGLPLVQHGIYRLLIDWYYMHERPLPIAIPDIIRAVGVLQLRNECGISNVLQRFFECKDDGWHHSRIDEELARYLAKRPEIVAKKAKVKARVEKHREDRAAFFKLLALAGCFMPWKSTIKQLRETAAKMAIIADGESPVTALLRRSESLPEQVASTVENAGNHKLSYVRVSAETLPYIVGSPIDIVRLVRAQGINGNWHDPRLIALINAGATRDEFESAAVQAKARKAADLWAYTLGVVSGRRKDAARMAQEGTKTGSGGANGSELVQSLVPSLAKPLKPAIPAEVIDVESKRLD